MTRIRHIATALACAALLAACSPGAVTRLAAVNTLFKPDRIVQNFSTMDRAFLTVPVPLGPLPPRALAGKPGTQLPSDVGPWVINRVITGLVVLKDGRLVHESYYHGTRDTDKRISWSVAKSFLSALFGIVLAEGHIASIDDPVTRYAPSLTGSAYDGVSIRQVLTMTSGVEFDEDYLNPSSDINRMGRVLALGRSMDAFAAGLKARSGPPGQVWRYVSIDTHVLGMVIRGATGRSIPDLMSEKLIGPLGLEAEPYYVTDGLGEPFVLGGLNMTTRDYARFGQMFLRNGRVGARQVVPGDWVAASTRASAPTEPGAMQYGFQWWIPPGAISGEFMAQGIYGQFIYVNRPAGVVIAVNAADVKFLNDGVQDRNIAIYRAIADSL